MRQSTPRRRSGLIRLAGPILAFLLAATASAQEVIRISSYKPLAGRNAEVSKVTDEEVTGVYAGMKGLKWVKSITTRSPANGVPSPYGPIGPRWMRT
jgi:hypothetical protein